MVGGDPSLHGLLHKNKPSWQMIIYYSVNPGSIEINRSCMYIAQGEVIILILILNLAIKVLLRLHVLTENFSTTCNKLCTCLCP